METTATTALVEGNDIEQSTTTAALNALLSTALNERLLSIYFQTYLPSPFLGSRQFP